MSALPIASTSSNPNGLTPASYHPYPRPTSSATYSQHSQQSHQSHHSNTYSHSLSHAHLNGNGSDARSHSHSHPHSHPHSHHHGHGNEDPNGTGASGSSGGGSRGDLSERADIDAIKRELHDALGEAGLPYWKTLNAYLLGQLSKDEITYMIRGWLKKNVRLHNRLLASLLQNAAAIPPAHPPAASPSSRKRRRGAADAPDLDDTIIEPRARTRVWVMGLGGKERARISKIMSRDEEGVQIDDDGSMLSRWPYAMATQPPLAAEARQLPTSHELAHRLSQLAKQFGLDISPDSAPDLGQILALGADAHLADILHGIIRLTGKGRPGLDTIRMPPKGSGDGGEHVLNGDDNKGEKEDTSTKEYTNGYSDGSRWDKRDDRDRGEREDEDISPLPKPHLSTLQALFDFAPGLHPQASPALYKLLTSFGLSESDYTQIPTSQAEAEEAAAVALLAPGSTLGFGNRNIASASGGGHHDFNGLDYRTNGIGVHEGGTGTIGTVRGGGGGGGGGEEKRKVPIEELTQTLLSAGMLKLDKAGRGEGEDGAEGGKKKERKHNLHWKYEDPAIIFKDVLG